MSDPQAFRAVYETHHAAVCAYEPLRFTDHSFGKDAAGKPFDQTYAEDIIEFETLPDTPENRQLLTLQ